MRPSGRPWWFVAGVVGVVSLLAALGLNAKYQSDYALVLQKYLQQRHEKAQANVEQLDAALRQIYQNLRTIGLLPGVRKIDRHGTNLSDDAHESIQQIYNNLASNVAVSEVYVVPVDLNADRIDPFTKAPEIPILMFDELIVGDRATQGTVAGTPEEGGSEEVEIYEYHLLSEQMAWIGQHFPDNRTFNGLNVPVIGGPPVITCDNTEFNQSHQDADRMGLVFSVPFYSPIGELKGTVSAIIRTNALQKMLPGSDNVLVNPGYGFRLSAEPADPSWVSFQEKAEPSPELLYSEVLLLEGMPDSQSPWSLWVGASDALFWGSPEMLAVTRFRQTGLLGVALGALIGLALVRLGKRNADAEYEARLEQEQARSEEEERERAVVRARQQLQEHSAEERRKLLSDLARDFEQSVGGVVSSVSAASAQLRQAAQALSRDAQLTLSRSSSASTASTATAANMLRVAASADELSNSILGIRSQVLNTSDLATTAVEQVNASDAAIQELSQRSRRIGDVVRLIGDISRQTNLLALNATIEAARAGDAGNGFAVVAAEVRNLARETGRAAVEIEKQVTEIQAETAAAVASIQSVGQTVTSVHQIAQGVTLAIHEQSLATQDISRSVGQASQATQQAIGSITEVSRNAGQTSDAASQLSAAAESLSKQARRLRLQVDSFIAEVRKE